MAVLRGNIFIVSAGVVALGIATAALFALKHEQNRIEGARNVQLASATLPDQNAHERPFALPRSPVALQQALPVLKGAGLPENHVHENTLNQEAVKPPAVNAYGLECTSEVHIDVVEGAMLSIDIAAPCQTGEAVTIRHAGLSTIRLIPESGKAAVEVPALADPAQVEVTFSSGMTLQEQRSVPDLGRFNRIVLTAGVDASLALHAFEFAAGPGEPGHIWRDAPGRRMARGVGQGGFLSVLSGPGSRTEIYSFPNDTGRNGSVRLQVELLVTEQNCGREVGGQTTEIRQGHRAPPVDLSFVVPQCDALGHILVLNNLLQDMTLAQN